MKKIEIYYGSTGTFLKSVPKSHKNLTTLALECDVDAKKQEIVVRGQNEKPIKTVRRKRKISCLVAAATEYCAVQEHVISNFLNFIQQFSIQNIYIQNPPQKIADQLIAYYGDSIVSIVNESYGNVTEVKLKEISDDFDEKIIGQGYVKNELLQALYPATQEQKRNKPITVLFYGSSGVGKTETANYLASVLGGKLFRKQFSMFQNNEFAVYLFGGKYTEKSFAQDLMARKSNVILLDEFDKANPVFHSAFYQLFDEGIYEDTNFRADLKDSIIICTSNYRDENEIKQKLGDPIFNRFDKIIGFKDLDITAKKTILLRTIEDEQVHFPKTHISQDITSKLLSALGRVNNAREIQHLVIDTFSLIGLKEILGN